MTIKSMTGFSHADGATATFAWHWELRSVNARGLDVRVRLPAGNDALEPKVREAAGKILSRGSVTVSLNIEVRSGTQEIRLNEETLRQVVAAAEKIRAMTDAAPPSADGLIAIKGVLEVVEHQESADELEARTQAILVSLDRALELLVKARAGEGARLKTVLQGHLTQIEELVAAVEASPARTPAAIQEQLKAQLDRLFENAGSLDPGRLHQEAVLVATRADVEEELKRLRAHIAAARELLEEKGAIGRKLDFLAQEFNREANTLCSKANALDITRAGLALKSVIDQMREQVQNIE